MTLPQDADGWFVAPDGCQYEHEWEAWHISVLGQCGCGCPEDVFKFLQEIVRACDDKDNWALDEAEALVRKHPDLAAEALLNYLNRRKVLEHGSFSAGSWPTPLGKELLAVPEPTDE